MDKITVVIPTYKRADFLARAVGSVLRQAYGAFEVVVVDDNFGCDEQRAATKRVLDTINDPRVRLIAPEKKMGGSGARNEGVAAAHGTLVTFLDDDDEYKPGKLSKQAAFMRKGFDLSFMDVDMASGDGVFQERLTHELPESPSQTALLREHLLRHLTPTAGYMFVKDALLKIGGFPIVPSAQEFLLMLAAIEGGLRIGYLRESLVVQYRHEGERISTGKGRIEGQKMLYTAKKARFHCLTAPERRAVRARYHASIAFVQLKRKKYVSVLLHAACAFCVSPQTTLALLKQKGNML